MTFRYQNKCQYFFIGFYICLTFLQCKQMRFIVKRSEKFAMIYAVVQITKDLNVIIIKENQFYVNNKNEKTLFQIGKRKSN